MTNPDALTCKSCGYYGPVSQFSPGKDGNYCKFCRSSKAKKSNRAKAAKRREMEATA